MIKLATLALALGACATTAAFESSPKSSPTNIRLDLATTSESARPAFPVALAPAVPTVDRLAHAVRARFGDTATAELDLCVSTSGKVTRVALAKSSTYAPFDAALLRDAEGWQFATMPGPDNLQSCRRTTIAYRVR